mmetsp:Transcript_41193/g.117519  ORF Transcript_41193/g.117519 Transcript_41193/m.117519 type:complete len:237 (+) Transcript_41193:251-961(+)
MAAVISRTPCSLPSKPHFFKTGFCTSNATSFNRSRNTDRSNPESRAHLRTRSWNHFWAYASASSSIRSPAKAAVSWILRSKGFSACAPASSGFFGFSASRGGPFWDGGGPSSCFVASSSSFSRSRLKMPASKALPSISFVPTLYFACAYLMLFRSASQSRRIRLRSGHHCATSSRRASDASASFSLPRPFWACTFRNHALWSSLSIFSAASEASSAVWKSSSLIAAWALFFRHARW